MKTDSENMQVVKRYGQNKIFISLVFWPDLQNVRDTVKMCSIVKKNKSGFILHIYRTPRIAFRCNKKMEILEILEDPILQARMEPLLSQPE